MILSFTTDYKFSLQQACQNMLTAERTCGQQAHMDTTTWHFCNPNLYYNI